MVSFRNIPHTDDTEIIDVPPVFKQMQPPLKELELRLESLASQTLGPDPLLARRENAVGIERVLDLFIETHP